MLAGDHSLWHADPEILDPLIPAPEVQRTQGSLVPYCKKQSRLLPPFL